MLIFLVIFFVKQKTAYDMRISDWSSDVCSSDLSAENRSGIPLAGGDRRGVHAVRRAGGVDRAGDARRKRWPDYAWRATNHLPRGGDEIGSASCRERVCRYV